MFFYANVHKIASTLHLCDDKLLSLLRYRVRIFDKFICKFIASFDLYSTKYIHFVLNFSFKSYYCHHMVSY